MPKTLYLNRDEYGNVTEAVFGPEPVKLLPDEKFDEWTGGKRKPPLGEFDKRKYEKRRKIASYKELVWAMCQAPTRWELFSAAWRRALSCDAELSSVKLSELENEHVEEAKSDAEIIENIIGDLVNDPKSRFYIHG